MLIYFEIILCFLFVLKKIYIYWLHLVFNFLFPGPQWEAKVTQYERDFERVSTTVRKEVIRFEVLASDRAGSIQNCWSAL